VEEAAGGACPPEIETRERQLSADEQASVAAITVAAVETAGECCATREAAHEVLLRVALVLRKVVELHEHRNAN
jgi:hypothetical protein